MTVSNTALADAVSISFRDEPLRFFDHRLATAGETFWLPDSVLCVAEPTAAKAVLANPDGLFEEHSDLFHTRRGPFGPRAAQVAIGRAARRLLVDHVALRAGELPATIERVLGRSSLWPHAGQWLIYRHLHAALVTPERAAAVGPWVDRVMERGVLVGARESRSALSRAFFRWRAFRQLTREVEHRVGELDALDEPRDLFDVLALGVEHGADPQELGELYVPLLFAIASSVALALGWSIHLLGTHPHTEARSSWVVREALRLWPVAWQLVRQPAKAHGIAGVEVTPERPVLVSPYVTQRHPAHWREPNRFLPERWDERPEDPAYFPFGWGPHTCVAAGLSYDIVRQVLDILRRDYRMEVAPLSDQPFIGPSLAPPRFRLDLQPLTTHPQEGGDSPW